MLTGRAHDVIYFRPPERWQEYPEWARHRREEIIARIKGEFREPDYEYDEDASAAAITAAVATARTITPPPLAARPTQGMGALFLFIVIFLALAAGMGWLVCSGLEKGATAWPAKRASQNRAIVRSEEPAMYWTAIGLYSAIGVGSAGFAAWLGKEAIGLLRVH
jgi:Na+-transporting methylmalonyl-CoA/oxaloacetate decarboxylase gamma subunit